MATKELYVLAGVFVALLVGTVLGAIVYTLINMER